MRTKRNIIRHELIGLQCEIVQSNNKSLVGIRGKIILETMKTLVIKTGIKPKRVQKKNTTFRLDINGEKVDVDGSELVARPEDRIKKKIRKW